MMSNDKIPHQDLVEEVIDERIERYAAKGYEHNFETDKLPSRFTGDLSKYAVVDGALVSTEDAIVNPEDPETFGEPVSWLAFDVAFYQSAIVIEVDLDPDGWIYIDYARHNNPNIHFIYGRKGVPVGESGTVAGCETSGPKSPRLKSTGNNAGLYPAVQSAYDSDMGSAVYVRRLWISLAVAGKEYSYALYPTDPDTPDPVDTIYDNFDLPYANIGIGPEVRKRPRIGIGGEAGAAKLRIIRVKNLAA